MSIAVIILAAGKGTRMRSDMPKVLHPIGGLPMLGHAINSAQTVAPDRIIIVAGHGAELVRETAQGLSSKTEIVLQSAQNGTAHAVDQARAALDGFDGDAIILFGDTPFIGESTLRDVFAARQSGADVVVLGFVADNPDGYGRLICDGTDLKEIVETKDASQDQLQIDLCNSGVMAADSKTLFDLISKVEPHNAQGEYYLTDIVGIANAMGKTCRVVTCPEAETLGINSRRDLATAEQIFQKAMRLAAMDKGVTLLDPDTVHFSFDTTIAPDAVIEPNVVFGPGVTIASGVTIKAFSHLEKCNVETDAMIGPYARLRPGTSVGQGSKIGNFVETKNARIDAGAKVNHLSYVGDAKIGKNANIGAGTITCNYDGVFKHTTEIGQGAFVGSNTALVAPVKIGANSVLGSGSVITSDVPDGDLAIARGRQTNKPGIGAKLMNRLRALKAKGGRP